MNQSKTIAIEILKERKIDVSEFEEAPKKVVKEAKSSKENPGPEMSHTNKGPKERPDVPKTEKKEEVKKEKAPKVKGEKGSRTSSVEMIDVTDKKVAAILKEDSTKTAKIKALGEAGYSVLQISKLAELNARYPFVRTVLTRDAE